jgi:hypothetical protein
MDPTGDRLKGIVAAGLATLFLPTGIIRTRHPMGLLGFRKDTRPMEHTCCHLKSQVLDMYLGFRHIRSFESGGLWFHPAH